jgi:hypothetical protein
MSRPRSAPFVAVAFAVVLGAGCAGTPRIAAGHLADAKARVLALVNATGRSVGSRLAFVPAQSADELPCKKKFLGYSVGDTGAHQAEVPISVAVTGGSDGAALLPAIEAYWRGRGYTIDRSGLSDRQFPKLRAHAGTDALLVATGYVGLPRLNLYAVSACVRP